VHKKIKQCNLCATEATKGCVAHLNRLNVVDYDKLLQKQLAYFV